MAARTTHDWILSDDFADLALDVAQTLSRRGVFREWPDVSDRRHQALLQEDKVGLGLGCHAASIACRRRAVAPAIGCPIPLSSNLVAHAPQSRSRWPTITVRSRAEHLVLAETAASPPQWLS